MVAYRYIRVQPCRRDAPRQTAFAPHMPTAIRGLPRAAAFSLGNFAAPHISSTVPRCRWPRKINGASRCDGEPLSSCVGEGRARQATQQPAPLRPAAASPFLAYLSFARQPLMAPSWSTSRGGKGEAGGKRKAGSLLSLDPSLLSLGVLEAEDGS